MSEQDRERAADALERIRLIPEENTVPEPFRDYFVTVAEFLLSVRQDADNRLLYADILPDHYDRSYGNPDYASEKLGGEYGPLLSAVYAELRGIIPAVFEGATRRAPRSFMSCSLSCTLSSRTRRSPRPGRSAGSSPTI